MSNERFKGFVGFDKFFLVSKRPANIIFIFAHSNLTFKIQLMSGTQTFTMIKPDAVRKGHTGAILAQINSAGFRIKALQMTQLTQSQAEAFYDVHKERPFFGELVSFMTSGAIVAAALEKKEAVQDFRTLIGATNPAEAAEGTIRKLYADSIGENAIHGSDADDTAAREIAFFFGAKELY